MVGRVAVCEVLGFIVLDTDDGAVEIGPQEGDQDAELERLLRLGARRADVGQSGEEQWHVLADPEGNGFCLLRARLS
ncbi:VOC family protein [Streptomyces acidicola]|uniref:Glyoxalase-like domain-containing protein n=1 Tax=Streptomyces acidicola TaxID=2596892 RepID=A0A5N8WZ49_9ACTN|nr:VOC family protein [Streptomyces acidicola]MPY52641.1 hypothetical protein [Streptomyces acidicola]